LNIPAPTSSQGSAPAIEDGLYIARFNDIYYKVHEDWAQAKDKFGKVDDGGRFHFNFTILDEDRQPVVLEDADEPDATLDLEAMTRNMSRHEKAGSFALLKGILTPAEFLAWQNSTAEEPADLSGVANREVNVQVGHSSKGWPQIVAALGPAKARKTSPAKAAQ
jgi:hypothetical protein